MFKDGYKSYDSKLSSNKSGNEFSKLKFHKIIMKSLSRLQKSSEEIKTISFKNYNVPSIICLKSHKIYLKKITFRNIPAMKQRNKAKH